VYVRLRYLLLLYFFFFSSRRRHTRSLRDWSSDVCSSDLSAMPHSGQASRCDSTFAWKITPDNQQLTWSHIWEWLDTCLSYAATRSEERRVGKECRSRWWPYQ